MNTTFDVILFNPASLRDVELFIIEHRDQAHRLMVQINPTGLGDGFADLLQSAGFTVQRKRTASNPVSKLSQDLGKNN
jgi:hypothetical protein